MGKRGQWRKLVLLDRPLLSTTGRMSRALVNKPHTAVRSFVVAARKGLQIARDVHTVLAGGS
jgi:hypothetical protein